MTTCAVHPDEVLKALLDKGNRRDKDEKLRKLHELCATEYARHSQGARDLSQANMSRIAESHGLFKARAIYNKQSEDYANIIDAWAAYNGPKSNKMPQKKTFPERYDFLKKIEDPAVRSLCQIALVERDKLKAELNLLKSKTQVVVDMRPLGAEIAKGSRNVAVIEMAAQLTDSEHKALEAALDPTNLGRRMWRLGDTGEVVDERDRFVFLPGFATAIRKILGLPVQQSLLAPAKEGKRT
ncbi:gamma-mobile-trio protein GmtX [Sulfuritalea hydrogenivorans]|uniref:Alpha/beta hydrolase fold protein n=1 Tax=Sulfuritalea hydrogenivorans sk43H TaxID=1223802 RepID=W0SG81_9PROT|nr:gamma-mobile-trio protein GmtX [Sulfuritalea hydrogenivorans]BAO30036.1 alpha/beta hydrolase fold protein [Sulfuritalea hydrogenivorans sk43H]